MFDTGFGIAWFGRSIALGVLYDTSVVALVVLSAVVQLAAVPLVLAMARAVSRGASSAVSA